MEDIQYYCLKRRTKFIQELPDYSLAIIPNKARELRSNDVEHKFKPNSDFYYLTGVEEPDSICIIKKEKRHAVYILFVEERNKEKEIWVGKTIGTEGAKKTYKAHVAYKRDEFLNKLNSFMKGVEYIYYPFGININLDPKITNIFQELRQLNRAGIKPPKAIYDPREIIHKLRLIKDPFEIKLMTEAAEITKEAHILTMSFAKSGIAEHELEASIEYKFRSAGALGPSYPSIVGSGNNSTILHYTRNNKTIQKNDLILIDAGCEYKYYASDVTRTFPANKKFTSAQKDIYEIVLEAQLKGIEEVKPGKRFIDSYNKAVSIIVDGLKELKLLKGSKQEIIKKGKYKKFFMHRLGHWLGLDVHDAGPYVDRNGHSIKLQPNMVMTVEPGIYIHPNSDSVPKAFRGIGIRIEDDVLITKNGNKVLTEGIPKLIEDIESLAS